WGSPRHRKVHTSLAGIAASLILVAIVHHAVEARPVTWDQVKRGDVPAAFGAVALVRWGGRRHRITTYPQVPVVRSRVTVRSYRYYVGILGFVHHSDGSLPCPEDIIRLDRRAAILPVASKLIEIGRASCRERG